MFGTLRRYIRLVWTRRAYFASTHGVMPLMGTKQLGLSVSTFRSPFVFRHLHQWQKTIGIGHRAYTDTLYIYISRVRDAKD